MRPHKLGRVEAPPSLAEVEKFNRDALDNELQAILRNQNKLRRYFGANLKGGRSNLQYRLTSVFHWRWWLSRKLEAWAKVLDPT